MTEKVSKDELLGLTKELTRQINNGLLADPGAARSALRALTSPASKSANGSSRRLGGTLDRQIETMKEFLRRYGGGQKGFRPRDVPPPPRGSKGAMLVAYLPAMGQQGSLQRTFEAWWEFFTDQLPKSYTVQRKDFKVGARYLRYTNRTEPIPGVYWVKFDCLPPAPERHSLMDLWKSDELRPVLAGPEMIMAFVHFRPLLKQGRRHLVGLQVRLQPRGGWHYTLLVEFQPNTRTVVLSAVGAMGATLNGRWTPTINPLRTR